MKRAAIFLGVFYTIVACSTSLLAQAPAKAVTVPVTLDHNRVVIDVYVPLKDGTTKRVRGLVDTARTDFLISLRVAQWLDKSSTCEKDWCKTAGPGKILIGGFEIPLSGLGPASFPARPAAFNDALIPGMSPEVILPATVWTNYDLVIDYANRQFTIGPKGSVKFGGDRVPTKITSEGLITVEAKIDGQPYPLTLNTGLPASLIDVTNIAQWHKQQPSWPYAAGSLAAENMTGAAAETKREVLRVPSLQLGTATLQDVMFGFNAAQEGISGQIGGEAFKGARIGLDYAHSALYIEQVNKIPVAAGLDVVGLTLRPKFDGRYTVVAVVSYEGQPSVADVKAGDILVGVDGAPVTGATMGQVWSLLGGEPGQMRKLVIERDGKRTTVEATVRRFLAAKSN